MYIYYTSAQQHFTVCVPMLEWVYLLNYNVVVDKTGSAIENLFKN